MSKDIRISETQLRMIKIFFLSFLVLSLLTSLFHFLVWTRKEFLISSFYTIGSNKEKSALEISRVIQNISGYIPLLLLCAGILLTVLKKKNWWLVIIAVVSILVVYKLDEAAYYLPN